MKNVYVYPYKMGSRSATALAKMLDSAQIRHRGSKFRGASNKVVINWGAQKWGPEVMKCRILNRANAVHLAANKLSLFRVMHKDGVRCVPFTTDRSQAERWLSDGHTVVVRNSLTGHSGHGIIIVEPGKGSLPNAPLYTKYTPKSGEFRVHIVNGQVVDRQRKIRDPKQEPKDWKVRSHDNGFIFVRDGITVPKDVEVQALAAFKSSGLDFGAVDVIHDKRGTAYVLEINTAPGLEGQTVKTYSDAFRRMSLSGR